MVKASKIIQFLNLRADAGLPLRTHYVRINTGGGWEPSRILNSGTKVNTFNGTTYRSPGRILFSNPAINQQMKPPSSSW